MSDRIPENSAQNSTPDDLQETEYACGHDGCELTFDTAHELAQHTVDCAYRDDTGEEPEESD